VFVKQKLVRAIKSTQRIWHMFYSYIWICFSQLCWNLVTFSTRIGTSNENNVRFNDILYTMLHKRLHKDESQTRNSTK